MTRKAFSLLAILALCLGVLPSPAGASQGPVDPDPFDAGPLIREMGASADLVDSSLLEASASSTILSTPLSDCTYDSKIFLILNDYLGRYQLTYFDLVGESPMTQVWVQQNLAYPAGDPRPTPVITCEQVAYLMGEFDSNIYPTETAFFGMPDFHDGSSAYLPSLVGLPSDYYYDEAGRQIVLVSNVRDDNYYDPTYPNYIAGFYSPAFETYFDRNIMSIDSHDWANRVGPDGTRPYLYEGIFAHEYQHLLHDDYDSDEESFVNEGMADLAMVLTGYDQSVLGHLDSIAAWPENSLVVWGDQGGREITADYGNAFLFQYYLMEKYGQSFIQALFHNTYNGISGINDTLAMFGSLQDFAGVFHSWSVAMLIDSKSPDEGAYWFEGLDFMIDIGTPDAPNPEAYDTPGAPPWGTDYMWVTGDPQELKKFSFNGVDYAIFPSGWTVDDGALWSGTGDLLDSWAIFEAAGGGTLSFDTLWDLEDYWDFGFVQVSTDGGQTWTSLEDNEGYSTYDYDPNAHPKVIENLPGLTSYVAPWPTWVNLSYDLSAYAGQDILVAFRLVTDWATHYGGWWIDNVYVDGTLISDGTDASIFSDLSAYFPIEQDFQVTFVGFKGTNKGNQYKVVPFDLDDMTEEGLVQLDSVLNWSQEAVLMVTFAANEGETFYADYSFGFESTSDMSLQAAEAKALNSRAGRGRR